MSTQNDKDGVFSFTYSAPVESERREIEDIRSRYMPKDEREQKTLRVKKLNAKVKRAERFTLAAFIIAGILVFGGGFSLITLNESGSIPFISGICVALLGILILALARPVYLKVKKYMNGKYGGEIAELCGQILSGSAAENTDVT
ncbi:MAG: hypothetical protein LUI60_03285 [Clostridia bacterium]|nr:hypothetical protein [Clostridia bacterium]